jgi:hypothetical protein
MIHIRHVAAAIASGLCETVLITHGASGRYASPRWATTCAALRIGDNTAESREFIADLARLESRQPPRPGRS